ncbi:MAG: GtrA family protein [Bacilli bacterium]|nr:GtrA family protein [Bacilli bacterium]
MNKYKGMIKQFIRFGIVGCINTFSSWFFYYPLIFINVNYKIATTIAYILSSIIGYILNNGWVFKKTIYDSNSVLKYYVVYGSSYILNIGCMYLWVEVLQLSAYIAPILTLFITVPYNFIFSKLWVFTKKKNIYLNNPKKYHTFAICAYKESKYLEECIKSIKKQSIKTNIIITSSTKNKHIENLAKKYNIQTYFRNGKSDIQDDWNFAVKKCKTELVTVAHQDDIYNEYYVENILSNYTGKEIMLSTNNYYLVKNKNLYNKNLKLKGILKIPLTIPGISNIRWIRKMTLSLGNTIQCPSVTYNKNIIGDDIFTSNLKFGLDWDTFFKLYKMKGKIRYIPRKLLSFRISNESTTKQCMDNSLRIKEDNIMFKKFWPSWLVKIIMKYYVKCYDVYNE